MLYLPLWAFQVAPEGKNPPAVQERQDFWLIHLWRISDTCWKKDCFINDLFLHNYPVSYYLTLVLASLMAQWVKNPPAMQETQVQSLGLEDPLKEETATHSSILAWKSPGQRSLVGRSPKGHKELDMPVLIIKS